MARQLGLRFTQPHGREAIELFPRDQITRAEAAWSFAKALHFDGSQQAYDRQVFMQYQLPALTAGQRKPLRLAVSKIGMPYVWGGETDTTRGADGPQVHGGYDCSGYVWRVFKLSGNPAGRSIGGRTAADQAGEIPKSRRIPFDGIRPADLLFFGRGSFSSGAGRDRPRGNRPVRRVHDQRLRTGRVRLPVVRAVAPQRVHVGAPGRLLSASRRCGRSPGAGRA